MKIGKWAALAACSLVLTLATLEGATRVYYWLGYASLTIPYSASDEERKLAWVIHYHLRGMFGSYSYDEYDPLLGWRLRPNLRDVRFIGLPAVTSNADGIRDTRELPQKKPAGVKRLVAVGDSFTFGEGGEQDHIWPVLLEQALPGWQVVNMGVHSYGTDQALLMLQTKGLRYEPDVVVMAVFVDDVQRNPIAFRDYAKPLFVFDGDRLRLTNVPVPSPEQIVAQHNAQRPWSYAWHFFRYQLGRVYGSVDQGRDLAYALRLNSAILSEAYRTTKSAGVDLLVVVIHFGLPGEPIEGSMVEWGRETGCPVLNLRDAFSRAEAQGEQMWGAHFTARGHEVVAQAIREKLGALGWAP